MNAALGLPGWLWCVTFAWNTWARLWTLRLVCWDGCGVCVTFAWNTWTRLWTLRLVCWDGCGVCYVCVEYVDAFVDTAPGLPG